jgi:hypothetical protein
VNVCGEEDDCQPAPLPPCANHNGLMRFISLQPTRSASPWKGRMRIQKRQD